MEKSSEKIQQQQEFEKLVEMYVNKFAQSKIEVEHFITFALAFAAKNNSAFPFFSRFRTRESLSYELLQMAKEIDDNPYFLFEKNKHGTLDIIYYLANDYEKIEKRFALIKAKPELPFPDYSFLQLTTPDKKFFHLDAKEDFIGWFERNQERKDNVLVSISFPSGIPSFVTTGQIILNDLFDICLAKVKRYLQENEKNVGYTTQKLRPFFRNNETALKELFNAVLTKTDQIVRDIKEPGDRTYYFWNQLCSFLFREFSEKKERQDTETSYAQAAYILGLYLIYYKGKQRKKKEEERALQILEKNLRKKPYFFTIADILSFTDNKGIPLTKFCPRERITDYISERTEAPDPLSLPQILKLKAPNDNEYYIAKELLIPLFSEKQFTHSMELKREYTNLWYLLLKKDEETDAMFNDEDFEQDIKERLLRRDPVFLAMLSFHTLYIAWENNPLPASQKSEMAGIFDTKARKLKPLREILNLDREKILKDAKIMLPFWKVIPVVSSIIRFFKFLFTGKKRTKRGKATKKQSTATLVLNNNKPEKKPPQITTPPVKASIQTQQSTANSARAFKTRIRELTREFVADNTELERTMEELEDIWNPLIDTVAKKNLTEDVENFAKDFLRKMRILNHRKPPTREQIHTMAKTLSENKAFERIKNKEAFRKYLELCMLKILNNIKI
ncbi:hypothetical protein WKV44_04355 [Spirochaetia bacterium 38H-sp]|uniref:Uncharacterized protein n=1 Tax=Rarispira pelagica TaxID=3141764 RepID=A0ABU9UCS4_9SPIR